MVSQDNRLMPLPSGDLDRPLRDLTQQQSVAAGAPLIEQAHLREYMRIVLKRRWLILSLVVIATSLTAIQMYRLPDIYQAETQIQIEPRQNVLQTREVVINSGQRDPTYWMTQLKLIQNPQLARQVVLALNLQDDPRFLGGQARSSVAASVRRVFSGGGDSSAAGRRGVSVVTEDEADTENLSPEQLARLEPYEDAVRGGLRVEPLEKTSLVNISYTHTNPEVAARVVNALAEVFIERDIRRERAGAERASELLARQIVDLQNKIKQKEEERIAYLKSRNLPFGNQPGGNLTADRLAILSSQLLGAEQERKTLQSSNETAKNEPDIWSVPEVQSDQRIQRLRDKIGELEEQKEALLVQYTAEWPTVKKVDAQIKKLKSNLDRAPVETLKAMDSRYQAALKREGKLREAYFHEKGDANEQILDQIDLGRLNQELETDKQYYNTMFQRQKEIQITSYDRSNNVSIATPARVPRGPVGPKRMRNIVLALMLSLAAGIGLAFLLDYLDDTLKSIEDVDRYIHLPTLALIPAPRSERLLAKVKGSPASEASEITALALVEDARSPAAEAYRHLRTSLLLSSAGQPPKSVLVTSSQPSEGKTTTAVNIAMMLAQTGGDVLLVDCDLRRPRIHTHFSLPNARGVTNNLAGETDLDSLLHTYDRLPNLKILTAGPVPPNPAELLGSDEMRKLIGQLSARFTHVIIDSPPAISFTDAAILSTLVDGVMLVVHGGKSSRSVVRRAKQILIDVGANIYGIVLNNVKLESAGYYYDGYYAGYYASDEEGAADVAAGAAEHGTRG